MEFRNKDLNDVLMSICAFDEKGNMAYGLLTENIILRLKRRLQKIHSDAHKKYLEYQKDLAEVNKIEDTEKKIKETEILENEIVRIDQDFASLELIEQIQTKANYNFEIIEKFSK